MFLAYNRWACCTVQICSLYCSHNVTLGAKLTLLDATAEKVPHVLVTFHNQANPSAALQSLEWLEFGDEATQKTCRIRM